MKKLDIINEIHYNRRFYYIDVDANWYKIAEGVKVPASPMISYKLYNDSKFYDLIPPENKEFIKELESELEKMLEEDEKERT